MQSSCWACFSQIWLNVVHSFARIRSCPSSIDRVQSRTVNIVSTGSQWNICCRKFGSRMANNYSRCYYVPVPIWRKRCDDLQYLYTVLEFNTSEPIALMASKLSDSIVMPAVGTHLTRIVLAALCSVETSAWEMQHKL